MWRRNRTDSGAGPPRCSFCGKGKDAVQKLIGSPRADVRVFICDECVGICRSILDDVRDAEDAGTSKPERNDLYPHIDDQLVAELVEAAARWIEKESSGADAAREFAEMRSIATRLIGPKDRT